MDQCDIQQAEDSIQGLLMMLTHRYHSKCFQQIGTLHIHPGQIPILMVLNRNNGCRQRELVETLHVKPPTVTVAVQRLEKAGIVYREQDGKDQRISRIYLTEKGENISKETKKIYRENEEILRMGFDEEELRVFRSLLMRTIENIDHIKIKGEKKQND